MNSIDPKSSYSISFENDRAAGSGSTTTGSTLIASYLGRKSFENEMGSGSATAAAVLVAFFFRCRHRLKYLEHAADHSV
jgi:hypothetical protein